VPGSISHITVPSSTKAPARSGSDMIRPEVSEATSTSRNASVRPRRSTAFSAACASDRRAVTWTRVSVGFRLGRGFRRPRTAPAAVSPVSSGPNPEAKFTSVSRSRTTK
jgi:hypothetical protein